MTAPTIENSCTGGITPDICTTGKRNLFSKGYSLEDLLHFKMKDPEVGYLME